MGDDTLLGRTVAYPERYDPSLLYPIPRAEGREALPDVTLAGEDIWNAYELSWLDARGKPQVACARLRFPAHSPNMIESKSLKLYFNSLNQSRFVSPADVQATIRQDLAAASGAQVGVELFLPERWADFGRMYEPRGVCLDRQVLDAVHYHPSADLLRVRDEEIEEKVYSNLFRSRCPVTGQPDWASVEIDYRGRAIEHASLLQYLVSYRQHDAFHEQCVERIFADLYQVLSPARLRVGACFTRRGGLDINPVRALQNEPMEFRRLPRQ